MAIVIVSVYLLCVAGVLYAMCAYGNKKNGGKTPEDFK